VNCSLASSTLEISPKRGIASQVPSVPYRRSSPVHKRIASAFAAAAVRGAVKTW
jgi:hypothetical protein